MANKNLFSGALSFLPRANAVNEAGGAAYAFDAKHALAQLAATGCFNGVFYASAETQLDSLRVRVGYRMHSRLHEMCEFLEYDGGDFRMLPANGGPDDLTTLWKRSRGRRTLPARTHGPAKAEFTPARPRIEPRPPRELKWPGGKAGRSS